MKIPSHPRNTRSFQFWPVIYFISVMIGLSVVPAASFAAPEEIQVYMDEINDQGEFGLDVHTNFVASGLGGSEFPGGQASLHRLRITPEFSLGLTKTLELGAYVPLLTVSDRGELKAQGVKVRLKFIAPHESEAFWWGLNYEIGRTAASIDENPWNGELKVIAGTRFGRWTLASNLNIDSAIAGDHPGPSTLDLDTRVSYSFSNTTKLGIEAYDELGPVRAVGHLAQNDHSLFLVGDIEIGGWALNLGVGHGFGGSRDGVIFKAIVSVPMK